MVENNLKQFLIAANKAGYASGQEQSWTKEPDGSTTITFPSGEWMMNDNFFGGEPYGGRTIVFLNNKPHWMMVYYGRVDSSAKEIKAIYAFLQKALANLPEEMPLRGPRELIEGEFKYQNVWQGDLSDYSGEETIQREDKIVYQAKYLGGLVDQRKED